MNHLVLVRHGESQLNVVNKEKRVYCGQIDTQLTDFGRVQASEAGQRLRELNFVQVRRAVASPLQRATETLSLLLSELDSPIARLPHCAELMERSHGEFEGLCDEEAFARHPLYRDHPNYANFMTTYDRCAPGGETLAMVSARAWPMIQSLMGHAGGGDLLVVSHYNTIRCVIGQALGLAPDQVVQISIPNAVPIILRQESEGYRLLEGLEASWG